ncbi:MAG TPA: ABC transporter ATP-binding protein [Actinomycetota bacterium]|nr:ABC transporter ATP-binding protein [Actinomycetota bacterium]
MRGAGWMRADAPPDDGPRHFGRRELRVLAPHLRPYAWRMLWALVLLLVAQGAALAFPTLLKFGIDRGIQGGDIGDLNIAAGGMVTAAAVGWWALRQATLVAGDVGEKALRDLRARVFEHLSSLDLSFFEREKAGRLVARLTADVETIELLVTETLVQSLGNAMYLIGSLVVLVALDWKLAAASLLIVVPGTTVAVIGFRIRSERAYSQVRERIAAVLSYMQETVRGVQVVQAFRRERVNAERFRDVNSEWIQANVHSFRVSSVFFPLMELISLAGMAIVLGYGGWRVLQNDLAVGVFAAFIIYLSSTLEPIQVLSQMYDTFQSAMAGLAKLAGLLEVRPTITSAPGASELSRVDGQVSLDDVTFSYREGLPPALSDVHLELHAGQTLALVGPTGAGKSTVAKLLLRFYDPTSGRVVMDGRDLREVSLESLRKHTAFVPQEGFLFGGTIRENIRFGRPGAPDDEVQAVCRALGIHETISALPEGYETQVRERGAALSLGQRQLVALARALLADPRLLVLDEATSSLDAATEAHVEGALRIAAAGRTTVVIAHRLATAARAQQIAVVEGGRIVESGSHDDLLARGGLYSTLYSHWLGG